MARPLRIEYPGAFYHVTARGNEQRVIYRSKEDRAKFLSFLQSASERYQVLISLFCLMDNHYHLLVETPLGNLSAILHHINAGYAGYYNRKYKRVGHLLQGRFKAILVEKDTYALELSRYIHLNPVRAGIVKLPEEYLWSSYHSYIGEGKEYPFLKAHKILSYFGEDKEEAKRLYRQFVEEGLKRKVGNPLKKVTASMILGNEEFIKWVKEKFIKGQEENRDIPALRILISKPPAEEIKRKVERQVRDSKLARRISLYLLHRFSGLKLKEIGQLFGEIGESGISQNTRRLEEEMERNEELKALIEEIKTRIV